MARTCGYCKVTQDVSERRRTEEALRQSEERYRLLVAGVRDYAILALDREGTVASWNAGAERIKGWAEHEIVGRHFSTFYPPSDIAVSKPQRELESARHQAPSFVKNIYIRDPGASAGARLRVGA